MYGHLQQLPVHPPWQHDWPQLSPQQLPQLAALMVWAPAKAVTTRAAANDNSAIVRFILILLYVNGTVEVRSLI